jgi:Arc/MetJ family transcription regulator
VKRYEIEIDELVVDASAISAMRGDQFKAMVEQALQQKLEGAGAQSSFAAKEAISISMPPAPPQSASGGIQFAGKVAQAIHQGMTRKP